MRGVQRGITTTFIVLVILTGTIALTFVYLNYHLNKKQKSSEINSFEDCAKLYPVMESYPEQCKTPDGKHFTRELSEEEKRKLSPTSYTIPNPRVILSPSPSSYPSPSPISMAECIEKYEGIRKGRIADSKNGLPFIPGLIRIRFDSSIESDQQAASFINKQKLVAEELSFSYKPYTANVKVPQGQEAATICNLINTPEVEIAEMPIFLMTQ